MRWAVLVGLAGCSEQGLTSSGAENIGVVTGDFDDVAEPFGRLLVPFDVIDGVTAGATWDPDYVSETHSVTIEHVLQDGNELWRYQLVLVASGARGLGDVVYNGVAPDDAMVGSLTVRANVEAYVAGGGKLLVTDWAYDLAEHVWPGKIDFVGDDLAYDGAQTGQTGTTTARVVDDRLIDELGTDVVAIDYDFSNWAPIRAVSDDVTVWIAGDVTYRMPGSEVVETLVDAPLLVSFADDAGRVVVSTFHMSAQTDAVTDAIYREVLGPLPEGFDTGAP